MTWTSGEEELTELRIRLIVASRAAGLEQPVDTVWIHLRDTEALRAGRKSCANLNYYSPAKRRLGRGADRPESKGA